MLKLLSTFKLLEVNMVYNIEETLPLFNQDGSSNPPFKVVDENNNILFYAITQAECEEYIQTLI